jgi:hypothetical protein
MPAVFSLDDPVNLTKAQSAALAWLAEHNGDGHVERWGTVIAAGERGPHTRQTWKALASERLVEFYGFDSARIRLTEYGTRISRDGAR